MNAIAETSERGQPAVFLDRDGTVIEEVGYLADPRQVALLPGAGRAIARLNAAGFQVIVVTNQSGVAKGLFPESLIAAAHRRLDELLAGQSARIDGYYVCPHHPEGLAPYNQDCDCRKPAPGLVLQAARERNLDLARSFFVGDKISDLQAGAAAGCRTILVRTGYGGLHDLDALDRQALRLCWVADSLTEAAEACVGWRFTAANQD